MTQIDPKPFTAIFEGPNRAGKTTLIEAMRERTGLESDFITLKGNATATGRTALEHHWQLMHAVRMYIRGAEDNFVSYIDRTPFPSDLIYRPVMEGQMSSDLLKHIPSILEAFEELNCVFVYVTASPEELKRRFRLTGKHWHMKDGEQIEAVHEGYETFFRSEFPRMMPGIPFIRIETEKDKKYDKVPELEAWLQKYKRMLWK